GGTPPYTFSATGLPAGITLSGAQLTGQCTASSTNVVLQVTDSYFGSASVGPQSLNCNPVPQITTASPLPGGQIGNSYNVAISTNATFHPPGAAPYTWDITSGSS